MATLYFYLWFILKLTLVAGQSAHYVLKGNEAILTPALTKPPDDILWKHNGDKVITFDSAEEHVFEPYNHRVTLAWNTAKLTISDIRYEDSGEYELDAIISERLYRSQYMLKVLDKVSKPVIRCERNEESSDSNNTSATLFCSSESNTPESLTFKWNLEGKSHLGQALPIVLGNEHDDIKYSCTANNPLQEETSVFMAKDCYTERTSEALDILVPIIIASLILLAFCIFPFIFRHQIKRACSKIGKNNDLEKQLNAVKNGAETVKNDDECDPLMRGDIHRQETILSPQRLPKQENVDETPQGRVKDIRKVFEPENPKNTETHRDRGKGNDTAISRLASPGVSVPKSDSGEMKHTEHNDVPKSEEAGEADVNHSDQDENEDESETQSPNNEPQVNQDSQPTTEEQENSGQTDSEKKTDEHHEDLGDNEAAGPSSSVQSSPSESTTAPEQKAQHKLSSDEDVQTTNEATLIKEEKTDHTLDKEPQKDPTVEPDPEKMVSEEESGQSNDSHLSPGPSGKGNDTATSRLASPGVSVPKSDSGEMKHTEHNDVHKSEEAGEADVNHSDQDENEDASETQSPNDEPQVNQDSQPTTEEQENSGQTDSEKKTDEHHEDLGDNEAAGPSSSVQSSPVLPKAPPQSTASPVHPVEHGSKEQTEKMVSSSDLSNNKMMTPDNKEEEESGQFNGSQKSRSHSESPNQRPGEQESRGQRDSEVSGFDESGKEKEPPGPQLAVSKSEEDQVPSGAEGKGHEESNTAGIAPQKQDLGLCKESENNAEKTHASESGSGEQVDESTHPPASSSSQHADNKETKDTGDELTEDANPLHVKETKDETDKESDSSGSGQRNGAVKNKVEQQDTAVDDKNSKT